MASSPVHVPIPIRPGEPSEQLWEEAALLPCVLSVDVPLKDFTVRDMLQLEKGSLVESRSVNGADVPVMVNSQLIGWAEFEVVGQRLAIRLTGLA
jgi:flagellar motor switch/type III secretory pathway protein FliN